MTPDDGSKEVDVFALPQVMFRMAVDKPFEISDINDNVAIYRIRLMDYTVSYADKSKTQKITGKIDWNTQKDALTFMPDEMLPPTSKLKARVNVTFEERKFSGWRTIQNTGMEITFTTGKAPDYIPESNIQYTYPVIKQRYFHPGESNQAYVQLRIDQAYLFAKDKRTDIRISSKNKVVTLPLTYDNQNKCVKFTLPKLDLNTQYSLEILSHEKEQHKIETAEKRTTEQYDGGNEVSIRDYSENKQTIQAETINSLLQYNFGTSSFNTFKDKINGVKKTKPLLKESVIQIMSKKVRPSLRYGINGGEPFESVELTGTKYTGNKALVSAYATLADHFYRTQINPLLYIQYPIVLLSNGTYVSITVSASRNSSIYGVPPVKAIGIIPEYLAEIEQGVFNNKAKTLFPYEYNLFNIYYHDFIELRSKFTDYYLSLPISNVRKYLYLLEYPFPEISTGNYEIELRYIFPNGSPGSSAKFSYSFDPYRDFKNELDINKRLDINKIFDIDRMPRK
jgi:hypothetical protein